MKIVVVDGMEWDIVIVMIDKLIKFGRCVVTLIRVVYLSDT